MPELLQLAELVEQHRVTEVEVGSRRVEARLDAKRDALRKPRHELRLDQQLVGAAFHDLQRVGYRRHIQSGCFTI
jgi:hypothetical protein